MKRLFPDDVSITFSLVDFYLANKEYEDVVLNMVDLLKIGNTKVTDKVGHLRLNEWSELFINLDKNELENTPELSEYLIHAMDNKDTDISLSAIVEQYSENSIAAKLYIYQDNYCSGNSTSLNLLKMLEREGLATEWQFYLN